MEPWKMLECGCGGRKKGVYHKKSEMDKVEAARPKGPRQRDIIDLEVAVFRDHRGLDWGQIDANHMSVGIFVGKFNSPFPGACADIKDSVRVLERGVVKFTPCDAQHHVVHHAVNPLLFIVVGIPGELLVRFGIRAARGKTHQ